jgi:hypothetical protein
MDAAKAREVAERSGNNFQARVIRHLREQEWKVFIAPHYFDPSTEKTREADLIAELLTVVPKHFAGTRDISIRTRLFIECKYIVDGVVFWMAPKDQSAALNWIQTRTQFVLDMPQSTHHHYRTYGDVAKVFASEKADQRREDSEPFFRAVNQCMSGYLYNQSRPSQYATHPKEDVKHFDYPVIMCSDFLKFYHTDVEAPADPVRITNPSFELELNYEWPTTTRGVQRDYFLLDVVDFSRIDAFLEGINMEIQAAVPMFEVA